VSQWPTWTTRWQCEGASDKQGSAATAISVLIVDDHQEFREGLRLYLGLQPEIHVVAEARNGEEATA